MTVIKQLVSGMLQDALKLKHPLHFKSVGICDPGTQNQFIRTDLYRI